MNPELPERLETDRLVLRVPCIDDAPELNAAILASYQELRVWMDWSVEPQTLEQTETFCRDGRKRWETGEEWPLLMVLKESGAIIGSSGLVRPDWRVPRAEIGYWCHTAHTGNGYVTELTEALTRYCFDVLRCERVELRMDSRNERSWAVPERLGFDLEATLHRDTRANDGSLRDTRVYVKLASP